MWIKSTEIWKKEMEKVEIMHNENLNSKCFVIKQHKKDKIQ